MSAPAAPAARLVAARACTALLLAGFAVAVYGAVVVGGGALTGQSGDDPDLLLSLVATAVVATGFEPLRAGISPAVRRLLGADRASPYEALACFAARAAEVYAVDEVAARMAHVLADATGAAVTEVWVCIDGRLRPAASWPPGSEPSRAVVVAPSLTQARADPVADVVVPVTHSGDLLGALVVRPAGGQTSLVERVLVTDLAAQAGLVLRNVALTAELQERLVELSTRSAEIRASRARLVAAQDAERRRLERDIHDGAQQHLVALVVNLRLAQTLAGRAPERAATVLDGLQRAVGTAEQTLRDLARGVYPAALGRSGLAAALEEISLPEPLRLRVTGDLPRYDEAVEAAAYFCCVEAVQNAVKHAAPTTIAVELAGDTSSLRFTVSDDGGGFDPAAGDGGSGLDGMDDRIRALGGRLRVTSAPGAGTTVVGCLPGRPRELVLAPPAAAAGSS